MMTAYELFVTAAFLAAALLFVWSSVKIFREAGGEMDAVLRRVSRKKGMLLILPGLMFLLCALYILLRLSWLFWLVLLVGIGAMGYAIGSGIGANMREH